MAHFRVVALGHGYSSTAIERRIVESAGGSFIDADAEGWGEPQAWAAAQEADAVAVRWTAVTEDLIRRLRRCRILMRYGAGYDNVDETAATEAGIMIGHVPGYCVDEVATHAIALLLACARHLLTSHQRLADGGWDANPARPMYRMKGRTIGLIGLGGIGSAVARKLGGWGCRLVAADPYVDAEHATAMGVSVLDLETLLRESDYLTLHVPFLPETRHLIDRRALALLKRGAILVNTSRGLVLDTDALLASLDSGQLAAAGLDVFEEEPLPLDSKLRGESRVVLTDHSGWYSEESETELHRTVAEEIVRVCAGGLPLAVANPEVLERLGRAHEWTPNWNALWRRRRADRFRG
jgi:D-3-phosphoglycerate dehydrogenase / 2-oxoglutarate reductase